MNLENMMMMLIKKKKKAKLKGHTDFISMSVQKIKSMETESG